MTQQQFAQALGVSVIAVSRWETSRPPTGYSLAQLDKFARDSGAMEIARVFQLHLDAERPKHFFETPLPPDEQALRELRLAAQEDGRRKALYVSALRALAKAHGALRCRDYDKSAWSETQKNLEWVLKHEAQIEAHVEEVIRQRVGDKK